MSSVDSAEKEASEVLQTLLSVERIEKQEDNETTHTFQAAQATVSEGPEGETQIHWHTPVSISHSLFSAMDQNTHFVPGINDQQVVVKVHDYWFIFGFNFFIK